MFLIVVDMHSKWLEVEIVQAAVTAHTKLQAMFATHGLPELLVLDNSIAFTSAEFQEYLSLNGVQHLTSALYHLSSNGLDERAVQIFKSNMTNGLDDDVQKQLSHFLFHYRSIPCTTTGLSPAEMLMGQHLQTHLDLIRPDVLAQVCARQGHQKTQHGHLRERSFAVGNSVSACNFATGQKWLAGTVVTISGQSFTVELVDGRTVHRHLDHIRSCTVLHPSLVITDDKLLDVSLSTDSQAEEVIELNRTLLKQSESMAVHSSLQTA